MAGFGNTLPYVAWADAFRRQDVETILSLLTPDYVLWAPGAPAIDRIGLRPALLAAFAANDITSAFECEERLVSGDLAFDRGWDTQTIKPRAAGECDRFASWIGLVWCVGCQSSDRVSNCLSLCRRQPG